MRLSRCLFRPSAAFLCYLSSVSNYFSAVRLLRQEFRGPNSLFSFRISSASVSVLRWLLGSPFLSFVFLHSLHYFRELPLPFASGFSTCPSFCFADCISLHAALLFLLSIQLVRSRCGASNTFLAIHLPVSSSSLWFFSSFASFRFWFLSPTKCNLLCLLVCAF